MRFLPLVSDQILAADVQALCSLSTPLSLCIFSVILVLIVKELYITETTERMEKLPRERRDASGKHEFLLRVLSVFPSLFVFSL
jgi:hypothetical protein